MAIGKSGSVRTSYVRCCPKPFLNNTCKTAESLQRFGVTLVPTRVVVAVNGVVFAVVTLLTILIIIVIIIIVIVVIIIINLDMRTTTHET